MFIRLLPGKSVIRSVAVCHILFCRTSSESRWCSASCSVVVSLFTVRYYTSIIILAKFTSHYKSCGYVLRVPLPLLLEHVLSRG